MTVTARRVLVLAAVGAMLLLGIAWIDRMGGDGAEVQIFDRPTSFCDEFQGEAFAARAAGVAATSGNLRSTVADVEAGFLEQISRLADTPTEARRNVRRLADEIQEGARTGDFGAARSTASGVDAVARERCR